MADDRSICDEVDVAVRTWRAAATHVVILVIALVGLPAAVCGLLAKPDVLPWPARRIMLSVYVPLIAAALLPRHRYRWRAVIVIASLYALAAEQLLLTGLVGSGRITLLVLPPLALVLLGTREGWWSAVITILMLTAFSVLAGTGRLADSQVIRENRLDFGYWLPQGLMLFSALVPLMVLMTRFLALQQRTMMAERQSRHDLEQESAQRRHLQDEVMRIGEEEKRRLGSELHDGLCQQLTAALLHCTAVENQLAARQMPEAGPVRRLRAMLEDSITSAHDAAKGLCPVDLEPSSLVTAMERLARSTREASGIACDVRSEGSVVIHDPRKALHLYRIAQEAVTNAVKHAQCRRIELGLTAGADAVTLRIRDDGVAPGRIETGPAGGMGMRLMAYRAEDMGGSLTIRHPPEGGTVIECRVPSEHAPEGPR